MSKQFFEKKKEVRKKSWKLLYDCYQVNVKSPSHSLSSDITHILSPLVVPETSLLAEVSHEEAKREDGETSAGFWRVSYHACAGVSLITSDVCLPWDTTHRTDLRAKL